MRKILLVRAADFSPRFPIDFLGMLAEKITNLNHVIIGYLAISYKCKQFAKHPDCNHVTPMGYVQHFASVWSSLKAIKSYFRGHC